MCGRFGVYAESQEFNNQLPFSIRNGLFDFQPNYNAAPSQMLPVLFQPDDDEPVLDTMKWGLIPHWAKDQKIGHGLINARSETVHEKPSFRDALVKRRALVPVNGWYEWLRKDGIKQPYWHTRKDDRLMWLAGLWELWLDKSTGESVRSFTILTRPARGEIEKIHDRMPVVMQQDDYRRWLSHRMTSKTDITEMIRSQPLPDINIYAVSTAVNKAQLNDATCIQPL